MRNPRRALARVTMVITVLVIGLLADLVVRVTRPTRIVPPGDITEELS